RRRHTRFSRDWSSDVCSSDLRDQAVAAIRQRPQNESRRQDRDSHQGKRAQHRTKERALMRILVVEDDPALAAQLSRALTDAGYRSEERRVGKERGSRWAA